MHASSSSFASRTSHALHASINARLYACWATSDADLRDAQRLRRQVFFEERAVAQIALEPKVAERDVDDFDRFCDHLLVKATDQAGSGEDQVVGTYRVLAPDAARQAGGYYTETEFELRGFERMRHGAVELGRSCVHQDFRCGGVIMLLWSALGAYMQQRGLESVIGCCSVSLGDEGRAARAIWRKLAASHLVPAAQRALPRVPFDLQEDDSTILTPTQMPPLMKGYMRCGARLLGPPAYDPVFDTADFPMLLRLKEMAPSYRQHFLGARM